MLNDDSVSPEVILDIGRRELEDAKDVLKRSVTQGEGLEKSLSAMQNVFGAIEFYEGIRGVVKD